jgi:manganese transport protein
LITRGLALIPAVALILITGGKETVKLLTFSQVVLSMQLSFAIFPLVMFTSDRKRMGEHASPLWLKTLAWAVCLIIAGLNVKLLFDALGPLYLGLLVFVGLIFATGVKFIGPKSKTQ